MYHYKVKFEDKIDFKMRTEKGIVAANCYAEAMKRVARFFGEEEIISVELYKLVDVMTNSELEDEIRK